MRIRILKVLCIEQQNIVNQVFGFRSTRSRHGHVDYFFSFISPAQLKERTSVIYRTNLNQNPSWTKPWQSHRVRTTQIVKTALIFLVSSTENRLLTSNNMKLLSHDAVMQWNFYFVVYQFSEESFTFDFLSRKVATQRILASFLVDYLCHVSSTGIGDASFSLQFRSFSESEQQVCLRVCLGEQRVATSATETENFPNPMSCLCLGGNQWYFSYSCTVVVTVVIAEVLVPMSCSRMMVDWTWSTRSIPR